MANRNTNNKNVPTIETQAAPSRFADYLPNPRASMVENRATRQRIIKEMNRLDNKQEELRQEINELGANKTLLNVVRQMHDTLQANGIGRFVVPLDERDSLIRSLIDIGLCAEKIDPRYESHNLVVWIRKEA